VWAYAGLGINKKSSANKTYSEKLNKAYNRILKCVVEEAAQAAINADNNALQKTFCEMTIAKGIAPQRAKLTISRDIIATAWTMWKKGEHYNPEIAKQIKKVVSA
jgi:transposase